MLRSRDLHYGHSALYGAPELSGAAIRAGGPTGAGTSGSGEDRIRPGEPPYSLSTLHRAYSFPVPPGSEDLLAPWCNIAPEHSAQQDNRLLRPSNPFGPGQGRGAVPAEVETREIGRAEPDVGRCIVDPST